MRPVLLQNIRGGAMRKIFMTISLALVMISYGLTPVFSDSGVNTYTEDFTSDNYLDLLNSTARWEPARGDVRLPAYLIERIGSFETPGKAWGAVVEDFRLYVADGYSGIQVYDLSDDPENPFYLGFYDAPGSVQNLFIQGDSLYVACGMGGYKIINKALLYAGVPDPDERKSARPDPVIMNSIIPGGSGNIFGAPLIESYTFDIEVARDSLAVIAQWDSVKIVKVKSDNINNLFDIVDGRDTPDGAMELMVEGNYIYLSEHNFGLRVLSFADIDAILGEYETPGRSYDFDIQGDYLYLAASEAGLHILDISNPESPTLVSTFDTDLDMVDADGYAVDVTTAGDYA
ncbi:MAG: hypothetical protein GF417_05395, partial [Candidatus Latescibacteria bacterium]|nr:hypothetical protein [bacterium]MBD3423850.1 hypothetical protein [Candidatus Latescibacterota bacterium]